MTKEQLLSLYDRLEDGISGFDQDSIGSLLDIRRENVNRILEERGLPLIDEALAFVGVFKHDFELATIIGVLTQTYPAYVLSRLKVLAEDANNREFVLNTLSYYHLYLPDSGDRSLQSLPKEIIDSVIDLLTPIVEATLSLPDDQLQLLVGLLGDFPAPSSLKTLQALDRYLPGEKRRKLVLRPPAVKTIQDVLQASIDRCQAALEESVRPMGESGSR